MTPLEWGRDYIRRGWRIVPILPAKKDPASRDGRRSRSGSPIRPDIRGRLQHRGHARTVSGELVDIDLDCFEALALADIYLPPTGAQFGRASKPRAHWLYIALGAVYESFADPLDGTTLLELRAAGRDGGAHQTMFPPSLHPSGERVEWHGNTIAPAVIAAPALRTATAWLAIGALARRYISAHVSENPGPHLPDLLTEADPKLGEAARRWLHLPEPRSARRHGCALAAS